MVRRALFLVFLGIGCGLDVTGQSVQPPSSSAADGGTQQPLPVDAGQPIEDAVVPVEDAAVPGDCYDLTKPDHGFTLTGATDSPNGVRIDLSSNTAHEARRDFVHTGNLQKTHVTISAKLDLPTGGWGTSNSDYLELIHQYFGEGADSTAERTATTAITLTESGVDYNIWSAADQYQGYYGNRLSIPLGVPTTITVATQWSQQGSLKFGFPQSQHEQPSSTAIFTSNKYKLVLGGKKSGTSPTMQMLITKVCVSIQ